MRKILSAAVALSVIFSLPLLGLAKKEKPKKETKKVVKAKSDKAKKADKAKKSKTAPSPELLKLGEQKYKMMCAVCHGPKGYGDGPGGKALKPRPSAFGKGEFRYGKSFESVFNTITKGTKRGMAPYGYLPEKERKALAYYVLHLSKGAAKAPAKKKEGKK